MCLRVTNIEKKIADNDIECYKVLFQAGKSLTAIFQDFYYDLGKQYTTEIGKTIEGNIYEGFHSCSSMEGAAIYRTLSSERIFKCIIPQGAEYYEGKSMFLGKCIEGYASNKIIIKEACPIN